MCLFEGFCTCVQRPGLDIRQPIKYHFPLFLPLPLNLGLALSQRGCSSAQGALLPPTAGPRLHGSLTCSHCDPVLRVSYNPFQDRHPALQCKDPYYISIQSSQEPIHTHFPLPHYSSIVTGDTGQAWHRHLYVWSHLASLGGLFCFCSGFSVFCFFVSGLAM